MRVEASGGLSHGVQRPPRGSGQYKDIDPVRMLDYLQSSQTIMTHGKLFNQIMFAPDGKSGGSKRLDVDWRGANGLKGLSYKARARTERKLSRDCAWMYVEAHLSAKAGTT